MKAEAQVRYSFTAQFIAGSVLAARRAAAIEAMPSPAPVLRAEHRASVVTAVMQAAAALESELAELVEHGPGHHLGSNGIDAAAREYLRPLNELVDRQPGILLRWNLVLYLLGRPRLDTATQPYQDADLLVGLRNELVHYRSRWDGRMKTAKYLVGLRAKRFTPPPFLGTGKISFFPHQLLGAACAKWAGETAAAFLDVAYANLGIRSVLEGHRQTSAELATLIPAAHKRRGRPKAKSR